MEIIKCYKYYTELKKSLENKTYDIMDDSIGQCNNDCYSVDVTLRDYDGAWCIDYDVYKNNMYLDGGKVCEVLNMPQTDGEFWKLIEQRFKEHIK